MLIPVSVLAPVTSVLQHVRTLSVPTLSELLTIELRTSHPGALLKPQSTVSIVGVSSARVFRSPALNEVLNPKPRTTSSIADMGSA